MNNNKTLNVKIPLTPAYANKYVTLRKTDINISIPLIEGTHQITSDLINVGNLIHLPDNNLEASITLWYHYDIENNILSFCSNELVSTDSTFITTVPKGTNQFCYQPTYDNSNTPHLTNLNWNYRTPLMQGLEEILQKTVQQANLLIIEQAKEEGFTVIVRTPVPKLSPELYEQLTAVYKYGNFVELYDPTKTYDSSFNLFHIDSVWYGEIYLNNFDYFANVIGSSHDPKIAGKSWIQLWQAQFGVANTCTSFNFNGFACSGNILGGHVILGKSAKVVQAGSNSVFIMPICSAHNNNNGVFMAPLQYKSGIALHNYMQMT